MNQTEQLIIMPIYKNNLEVSIRQDTKEAIGLIDHDISDTFPIQKFKVGQSIILFKEIKEQKKNLFQLDNKDQYYSETTAPSQCKNQLLQVDKQQNNYNIMIKNNYPTYVVVKDYKNEMSSEYPIQLDSIIRLGRVEYHVIEERTLNMHTNYAQTFTKNIVIEDNQTVYQCRFCFMEGRQSKESLYLTNICRCQGNSKAVHLDCLKVWVDQCITKEETQFGLVLKWTKAFECQVCKDNLPNRVQYQGEYFDLFTLERPDMQYILLQNINRDKNVCNEMYLIHNLLQDSIKIGRAFTCDIKAQDITVSRHHASIKITDGNFVITDNKSKFGTLVSINKETQINCSSFAFQQGKLLIQFTQQDFVHKSSPSTQHKLTQLPQISKQQDEDEPQMDDDSFQQDN